MSRELTSERDLGPIAGEYCGGFHGCKGRTYDEGDAKCLECFEDYLKSLE